MSLLKYPINELSEKLEKVVVVYPNEMDDRVEEVYQEIVKNNQIHGRSLETLRKNVERGIALELGAKKLLEGSKLNNAEHDKTDPNTFAWDLEYKGIKFEIKSSPQQDKWFNFNVKGNVNESEKRLTRSDLTTFLKYKDYVDIVLVGDAKEFQDGYAVKFKWIIDAKNFEKFMYKSRATRKGTTNYYHVKNGEQVGDCISLID